MASSYRAADHDYRLDHIETAFPRPDSIRPTLHFANGKTVSITTNFRVADIEKFFVGKRVKLCWYDREPDAEISQLTSVTL